ncbi:sterol desaturase family protein [Roseovarius spongiae]|uniref:Sterol desaturase family protein n=1 Tax=Roseovarius spongiae TaxID=2320272 RepID=A0A3A8AU05_9RHOB|nr:sterol desaturase family protein [Roseovarius spongiae]RKF15114.1 sterol desaturase family protein [Roseovarius spongiae]
MEFDWAGAVLAEIWDGLAGPATRLWPVYLGVSLLIAYALYRLRRIEGSFLGWIMPRAIYLHPSHIVDLKIFVLGRAIAALGLLNVVFFGALVAQWVGGLFGEGLGLAPLGPVAVALLLLTVSDFGTYWVHRIHHENRIFWPFHSVHHSAEVMTPITVFRKHPFYDVISTFVRGLFIGVLQGVFIGLFAGKVSLFTLIGVNAGYVLFNMAGSNLRHTHVWLGYGKLLSHIFISPAQHQIHHSLAPEHHNKNYGEVLAIWDWMFGTLYVPQAQVELQFGLGDRHGNRLAQRHDSLRAALVVPVQDSWKQVKKRFRRAPPAPQEHVTPAE